MKRALHFDFHTNGRITDFGKDFDPVKFASQLKDANVGYINFFCQCNMRFFYYPTHIGIRYPYMQGDLFGSVLGECKKVGVVVIAFVNIGLNYEQSVRHPEHKGTMGIDAEHTELIAGKEIYVKGEFSEVKRLPDQTLIPSSVEDAYTKITLPAIVGYNMFLLK